ncbi:hypothetical protein [Clostridioides difficile]|uniref:hypothetical protein n=1 Tax=Clostridioides difficile TaxID=1496 RepID=UPI00103501EA|nr:hypothetical protein [Clostridioides difficile]MDM9944114.1 hypothetical protein [Clostridioides difficile]
MYNSDISFKIGNKTKLIITSSSYYDVKDKSSFDRGTIAIKVIRGRVVDENTKILESEAVQVKVFSRNKSGHNDFYTTCKNITLYEGIFYNENGSIRKRNLTKITKAIDEFKSICN